MDKKSYKDLTDHFVDYAIGHGCDQARIELNCVDNFSVDTHNGKVESLQQSSSVGLTARLFIDGKYGSYSTNRLNRLEVENFIRESIATTRYLGTDFCRTLPAPERYFNRKHIPSLGNYDAGIVRIPTEQKIAWAIDITRSFTTEDKRIISLASSLQDRSGWQYLSDSQGFRGESEASVCAMSASVSLLGDNDCRPSDYWHEMATGYDRLHIKESLAEKAYEAACRKIGQKKIASGTYTIIVTPRIIGKLLNPVIDVLYGANIYQKRSFLADKKGEMIANPILTLTDQPHRYGALGACHFDFEGVATHESDIIRQGVLQTFFFDTYYANKLQVSPTVSAPMVPCVEPGQRSMAEIIADQDCALLITDFNGGNYNEVTGDYSFGIEGQLIRNGIMTEAVAGMNITGNLLHLWKNLCEIGNETEQTATGFIPTMVFRDVMCNGE